MSWPTVALGDVFDVERGGSPRPINDFLTDDDNGLNWVMISDATASGKVINSTKKKIRPEGLKKTRQVYPGDFILSNSMSFGRPYIMGIEGCIHDGWLLMRPRDERVDPDYFYHLLGSSDVYNSFASRAAGATVKNLNSGIVREVTIPLPPLEEQKRIAGILDQADSLRRLRTRALDKLNTLGQAIFHEMFGVGEGTPRTRIGDFALVKGGKRLPKGSEYSLAPTAHPYIRVSDLGGQRVETAAIKFISPTIHEKIKRYIVHEGDVIISIAGSIGVTVAVPSELSGANLTENAAKITPKDGEDFDATYLSWALSMPEAKAQISASTGQVTIGKLALFRIENLEIPMPSLDRQEAFSDLITRLGEKSELLAKANSKTNNLFASLQHRAFRGEL
ncbi:restriction endonuclease subunit S [Sulfitobacter pontiacus]|uniref:restriction endonuclease subunit S n=1 Tax=Sulfitobacter pontiacus TaxID=60137 RepID=UPI0030ED82BF